MATTSSRKRVPKKTVKKAAKKAAGQDKVERRRLWLMYPSRLIKEPVVWKLGVKFELIPNVRQASVTDELGIVCLELSGRREKLKAAVAWLEKQGIRVDPVEINVMES